jgi:hypothetical protein
MLRYINADSKKKKKTVSHAEHHEILTAVNIRNSSTILLSGTKGLLAAAKFLEATGAFTATGRPITKHPSPTLPGLDTTENPVSQETDYSYSAFHKCTESPR